MSSAPSYSHGTSSTPLSARRSARTCAGPWSARRPRGAGRALAGVPRHLPRALGARPRRCARGLLALGVQKGDRVGIWSPNRFEWVVLQYATARIGAILVNINPAYKTAELEYALRQSGTSVLLLAPSLPAERLRGDAGGGPPPLPGAARGAGAGRRLGAAALAGGDEVSERTLRGARGVAPVRRPDQHPVHVGHHRLPEGRDAVAPQHPQQRLLRRREAAATRPEDRVCIPVPFYHCFGMVLGNLACTTHGACMVIPGEAFDPLAVLETVQTERCTSLYGVPTMFIARAGPPALRRVRSARRCAPASWRARRARWR